MSTIYDAPPARTFLLTVGGDPLSEELGWTAAMVLVDNFTNQYLYIPGAKSYVAPGVSGRVLPIQNATLAQAQWQTPPGVTAAAIVSGQQATVTFLSPQIDASPSPGVLTAPGVVNVGEITGDVTIDPAGPVTITPEEDATFPISGQVAIAADQVIAVENPDGGSLAVAGQVDIGTITGPVTIENDSLPVANAAETTIETRSPYAAVTADGALPGTVTVDETYPFAAGDVVLIITPFTSPSGVVPPTPALVGAVLSDTTLYLYPLYPAATEIAAGQVLSLAPSQNTVEPQPPGWLVPQAIAPFNAGLGGGAYLEVIPASEEGLYTRLFNWDMQPAWGDVALTAGTTSAGSAILHLYSGGGSASPLIVAGKQFGGLLIPAGQNVYILNFGGTAIDLTGSLTYSYSES